MIWLALLLATPAEASDGCRRYVLDEIEECEIERDEHDVLDAAARPRMRELGDGGIRFSTMPALGGRASIIELRRRSDRRAVARWFALEGHPRFGWTQVARGRFMLNEQEYREFAELVGRLLDAEPPAVPTGDEEAIMVCTDGPGYLTERVDGGVVESFAGSCPRVEGGLHPNATIACRLAEMLRRREPPDRRPDLSTRQRCGSN